MLRPSLALGALASVLVLAGACGGSSSAGPSAGTGPDGGTVTQPAAAGLPCDVDKVLAANCRKCHDAHASQDERLLQAVAHDPFAEGACDACHPGAAPGDAR